jgi:hypothetical protein
MNAWVRAPVLAGLLALALSEAAGQAAAGAPQPDAFLARLVGDWDMPGTFAGKTVHYRGTGRWLLKNGWLCLSLLDLGVPSAYQADVYLGHDAKQDDYIAHWLDQFGAAGARVVGTGQRDGQTLVLLFPYADGAFRDTLTLAPDGNSGTLLIESQRADGSWTTFASYRLGRIHHLPSPAAAAPGVQ